MVLISRTDIAFSVFLIWILWDVRVSACLDLRSLNFRNGAFPHLRFAHVGNYFVEFGFIFCILLIRGLVVENVRSRGHVNYANCDAVFLPMLTV